MLDGADSMCCALPPEHAGCTCVMAIAQWCRSAFDKVSDAALCKTLCKTERSLFTATRACNFAGCHHIQWLFVQCWAPVLLSSTHRRFIIFISTIFLLERDADARIPSAVRPPLTFYEQPDLSAVSADTVRSSHIKVYINMHESEGDLSNGCWVVTEAQPKGSAA